MTVNNIARNAMMANHNNMFGILNWGRIGPVMPMPVIPLRPMIVSLNQSVPRPQGNPRGLSPTAVRSFMSDLRTAGTNMRNAAAGFSNVGPNVFSNVQAVSSDPGAVSVRVTNQTAASAHTGSMNVDVHQLAAAQRSEGFDLTPTDNIGTIGLAAGRHHFTVTKGGVDRELYVDIANAGTSIRAVQGQMATAINQAAMGITASVRNVGGDSTIVLAGRVGANNAFTLADGPGAGGLVAAMGLDTGNINEIQAAQDAHFTVNGDFRTADRNTVELAPGIQGTFHAATVAGGVTVSTSRDVQGITGAIQGLLDSFNNMRDIAARNALNDTGARSLQMHMESLARSFTSQLGELGIAGVGRLQIVNPERLEAAITSGRAQDLLNTSTGFVRSLSNLGQRAATDPLQFVSRASRTNMDLIETPGGWFRPDAFAERNNNMFFVFMSPQGLHWNMMGSLFSARM